MRIVYSVRTLRPMDNYLRHRILEARKEDGNLITSFYIPQFWETMTKENQLSWLATKVSLINYSSQRNKLMSLSNKIIQVIAFRASCIIGHRGYQPLQSKFESIKVGYTRYSLDYLVKPADPTEDGIVRAAKEIASFYMLENGYDWEGVIYPRLKARFRQRGKGGSR